MKSLIKNFRNAMYLVLILVLSGCCNNEKELMFQTKKCLIIGINTEGFELGDVLSVGENGQLIKADAEDIDNAIGLVVSKDSIKTFSFSKWYRKVN